MKIYKFALFILVFVVNSELLSQPDYNAAPMQLNVNSIRWNFNKTKGEGGLTNQYSWNFASDTPQDDYDFFWPQDHYLPNMLYQIFSPLCLTDSGIVDTSGVRRTKFFNITNNALTDWTWEQRRFRPPDITVDGFKLNPPYKWSLNDKLAADQIVEFEDLLPAYGLRSHIKVYAFSNPELADIAIWEITLKFTGEIKLPRENPKKRYPDQTIEFWWPFSMSMGPSLAGMREVYGYYGYESEDDLDSWLGGVSKYNSSGKRNELKACYYYDYFNKGMPGYPKYKNNSQDNQGDPDKTVGHLFSTQIPGYALLYAQTSSQDQNDDINQPYSLPHAGIVKDLWGRRDFGLRDTYIGNDSRGRFPKDPVTQGWVVAGRPEKGPMRFITVGPYKLSKDESKGKYDSITFAYAIGVGSISWKVADSVGKAWFGGKINDQLKNDIVISGRDSLLEKMDRALWAYNRIKQGLKIPSPPPAPDVTVQSGPDRISVKWSYPQNNYFQDIVTGVDDWYAWRVYKKKGAFYVNDPLDKYSGDQWELVYETRSRDITSFTDTAVIRGVNYYYAVTAVDDGSKNDGLYPGQKLESSRYINRSQSPAASFKPGLNTADKVRVVPNPSTVAAGPLGFPGTPDKILFVNLPVKCKLRIYTETGDFVKSIDHFGKADEQWDQRTSDNQYVASGIYILAVTEGQGLTGDNLKDQFVKFVIIR